MNREKAELWFDAGNLLAAEVHPAPMEPGYIIQLRHRQGGVEPMSVARSPRVKVYRTADAALSDARKIGFQTVTVYLG